MSLDCTCGKLLSKLHDYYTFFFKVRFWKTNVFLKQAKNDSSGSISHNFDSREHKEGDQLIALTLLKYTGANQVMTLPHPKVNSSSAGPHLPGPWVWAPHTCPLIGHRNTPLTSYLNQTLVSTGPSKRGITSKYQNLIHWYEVGRDSARHLLIRSNVWDCSPKDSHLQTVLF